MHYPAGVGRPQSRPEAKLAIQPKSLRGRRFAHSASRGDRRERPRRVTDCVPDRKPGRIPSCPSLLVEPELEGKIDQHPDLPTANLRGDES
jgi:hypothetical protein